MSVEFRLPDVGEGLEEAEIVRWLVAPGDAVERDQPVVEIQTDKALVEIPAPAAGQIERLAGGEGTIVKVGEVLFVLEDGAPGKEEAKEEAKERAPTEEEAGARTEPASGAPAAAPAGASGPAAEPRRPKAAPAVRRLATELEVDLAAVAGSGPGGRILAEDVRRAARGAPQARAARGEEAPGEQTLSKEVPGAPDLGQAVPGRMPLAGVRRVTARTMTEAWSRIPHIHSSDELDASALLAARRGLVERAGERGGHLTLSVFFVLAAARALRRYPLVNASFDMESQEIVVHEEVNVGLAAATPAGLIVPVVRHADRRSLFELAAEVVRLVRAARERTVKLEELQGGTFTVTNFGSLGGRYAAPIIRPPEAGILGFGAVRQRPWVVEGRIEPRPVLPISFGADHRLVDGDLAVAFQEHVRELLSDPVHLLLGE